MKSFAKITMGCGIFLLVLVVAGVALIMGAGKLAAKITAITNSIPGDFFSTGPNGFLGSRSITTEYKVDGDKVFYGSTALEGADAKSFTLVERNKEKDPDASSPNYGKDAKRVYYGAKVIPGAVPATFKDLGWPLASDVVHVYYEDRVIEGADPATFGAIEGCMSRYRDRSHVYARDKIIEGADPATYEPVGDGRLGRDKNDYYLRNNDDYDNGEFALHVCDMVSFKLLIPAEPPQRNSPWEDLWSVIWARDNQCFYVGDKVIPIADPATFQNLGQGYAKDAKNVYYLQHVLADADPQTFQLVSPNHDEDWAKTFAGYGKDAKLVYFREKVLQGADAATFTVVDEREFKDKNHHYNQGRRLEPDGPK